MKGLKRLIRVGQGRYKVIRRPEEVNISGEYLFFVSPGQPSKECCPQG